MPEPVIIDVRCRMPSSADGGYFAWRTDGHRLARWNGMPPDDFFGEMKAAGIGTAVSVTGNSSGLTLGRLELPPRRSSNDEQAALQQRYPGRFLAVAGIDVSGGLHDPIREMERCAHELGIRRVGIEPGRGGLFAANPADRRLYDFYQRAQELGVTVMLQTSGFYGGKNLDYANPCWIDQVAENFPDLKIVCGHGCYPFVREMIAVAVRRDNVFPSPDLYVFAPTRREWVYAVNKGLIADRFLFASGFPLCGSLVRSVNRFLLLGWRPRVLDGVLYRNAIRALGLEDDPAFAALRSQSDRFGARSIPAAAVRLAYHELLEVVRRRKAEAR